MNASASVGLNEVQQSENDYGHGWNAPAVQWRHENAPSDRWNVMHANDHGNESGPTNDVQDTFL